jgi:Heavy metal associated domain 2
MRPTAVVVHRLAQRTRLRIPSLSGHAESCDRLAERLSHCPGVGAVRASPLTASVVIGHDAGAFDEIVRYGRELDLFDLDEEPAAAEKPPAAIVHAGLARIDRWIQSETRHRASLNSVTVAALLAGAVWQAARGQLLPTAVQLMWYALVMVPDRQSGEPDNREQQREDDAEELLTGVDGS